MIEASLLIVLCLLVLSLAGWNIMVHHWLGQGRAQEAAHRAQIEATLQGLARCLSDAEELLGAVSDPKPHNESDGETEPSTVFAETEVVGNSMAAGRNVRPAEAELLAKLSRYRDQSTEHRTRENGTAEAV